jgi:hypothetical protein
MTLNMKKYIQKNRWSILGGILGGISGYFYWKEIGCSTGTCPITSKPLNSIFYFTLLGYLMMNTITAWKEPSSEHKN